MNIERKPSTFRRDHFDSIQEIDGSVWKHYVWNNCEMLLTEVGTKLLSKNSSANEILLALKNYKRSTEKQIRDKNRKFISKGSTGSVYKLGDTGLAMKECLSGVSLIESIQRMDILKYIVDNSNMPEWIGMPEHYGALEYKTATGSLESFMLMQEINCGVTVGDIIEDDSTGRKIVSPKTSQTVQINIGKYLGELTEADKQEVLESVTRMEELLRASISEAQKNPNVKKM